MRTTSDFAFNIDVPMRNEWGNVDLVVTSVQNCFNAMFADVDGSQTVAMVTGELLENAIKYGAWDSTEQHHLRLAVSGQPKLARVVVENPARPDSVRDLQATLAWIAEFPSASDAYRARLLALGQLDATSEISKLGLVRIAYEARCTLSATWRDNVVRVTAELIL